MSVEWKKGDFGRLTAEFGVDDVLAGVLCVRWLAEEPRMGINGTPYFWLTSLAPEVVALAERIERPYVPQVGDIVERKGLAWRIDAVDGETVLCDGSRRFPIGDLTLIARKGEVYR